MRAASQSWAPQPTSSQAAVSPPWASQPDWATGATQAGGSPYVPDPRFDPAAAAGSAGSPSLFDRRSVVDQVESSPEFARHRLADARRRRRRAVGLYCTAVGLMLLVGGLDVLMRGPGTEWYLACLGVVVLLSKASRDYQRGVFRGAPPFSALTWVVAVLLLLAGLAAMSAPWFAVKNDVDEISRLVDQQVG